MENNKIEEVTKLLRRSMVKKIAVESATKYALVQTVWVNHLTKLFRGIGILSPHEDLDDEFVNFLELSPDEDDIIMIAKLKKALKDIK